MADNVVRRDVIQIDWDVGKSPLGQIAKEANALKQSLGGVNDDGIKKIADTAKQSSSFVKTLKGDLDNSAYYVDALKNKLSSVATALKPSNVLKAMDNQLLSLQWRASETAHRLREMASTKITGLSSNIKNVVSTLTQGQTGIRGFTTALKSLASISLMKITDGARNLASNLKNLAGSALSKAKSGLQSIAKISWNALKQGITVAADKLKTLASNAASAAGNLAKCTGGAILGGLAAVGTGMIALGTSSIKAYAEYEQLVGGVETLFGAGGQTMAEYAKSVGKNVGEVKGEYNKLMSAQSAVFKNAENAYKTAGLSANAYMDTVTSFSASLIQSVGGDTAKAAKYADLAITDMSDNANKMGTDMSMIQNAYQGFAKQNYTMLDNLKLGYGGTKEEMERLLKDAEKISGQKFDLSSYADVVQAIHVIQDEMGITGTTAKEASSTIQGSFNSMKAAWTNFITGMADPKQDFDTLVGNLVDSVTTFGENLIPRIQVMLPRLVDGISQLAQTAASALPGLLTSLLPSLVSGASNLVSTLISTIQANLPQLSAMAVQIISQLAQFLLTAMPQIMVIGIELITTLCQGLAQQMPTLVPLAIEAILTLVNSLTQNLPLIIEAALQIISALIQGLIQNISAIIQAAIQLITALLQGLIDALPLLVEGALQLIMALVQGLIENLPLIVESAVQLITSLVEGLVQAIPMLIECAMQLIMALTQGLMQNLQVIIEGAIQIMIALALGLIQAIPMLLEAIPQIFMAFCEGLLSVNWLQLGIDVFTALADGILSGIASIGSSIWEGVKGIFGGGESQAEAKTSGTQTMNSYGSGLSAGTSSVSTATSGISSTLNTNLTTDLTSAGTSTIGTYNTGLTSGVQGITTATTGVTEGIKTDMNLDLNTQGLGTMTTFDTGLTTGGADASATAKETAQGIKSTFDSIDLTSSGSSMMSGFIAGMNSMKDEVISTAQSIAEAASSTIDKALDINSPSKVAIWQAQMYGKGLVVGAQKSVPAVQSASYSLADAMYMPESSSTGTTSTSYETNNFNPQFTLNFSGNADKTAEKAVKQWVRDALEEVFASLERTNPRLQEV